MEVLAERGNAAEALQVYEQLRVLLRDELGTVPGEATQELHRRVGDRAGDAACPGLEHAGCHHGALDPVRALEQ